MRLRESVELRRSGGIEIGRRLRELFAEAELELLEAPPSSRPRLGASKMREASRAIRPRSRCGVLRRTLREVDGAALLLRLGRRRGQSSVRVGDIRIRFGRRIWRDSVGGAEQQAG